MRRTKFGIAIIILTCNVLLLSACGESASLPLAASFGPHPQLPTPKAALFPTVEIAPAVGWHPGEQPTPAPGLAVTAFAAGLDPPRNLCVLPNGDVLAVETNAPPKPDDNTGLRGLITQWIMSRAGAGVPSANRIILLRDTHSSGFADMRSVFLEGLHSPYGIALVGDQLFVADTDAIRKYRTIEVRYARGSRIYTHGTAGRADQPSLDQKPGREPGWAVSLCQYRLKQQRRGERSGCRARESPDLGVDARTGQHRSYATGLRNPNGLAFALDPKPVLWTVGE